MGGTPHSGGSASERAPADRARAGPTIVQWGVAPIPGAPVKRDRDGMSIQRSSFGRDPGLQTRMLITLLLLGGLYVVFVLALLAAGAGAVTMAVVLGVVAAAQLLLSERLALRAVGAHITTPEQAPGLHAVVERLCVLADLPKPKVAIADTPVPNAFALGRSRSSAVVCATTGLLRTLEPHELQAVMAHELSHVQNRDVLVMTVASFFASLAAMLTQFGLIFGAGRDRDGGAPAFAIVLVVSFVVYAVSFFSTLALSRYREFAADRGAAIMTGRPSALSLGPDQARRHDARASRTRTCAPWGS